MRAKDLSGCHLFECLQKEAGNGPGEGTENSFGGEGGIRDSIHHSGAAKQRSDSEGHAPAEAGKAYSQKAGPTRIQQAVLKHVWKGVQQETVTNGIKKF